MATKIDILRHIILLQNTKTNKPKVTKELIREWKDEIKNKRYSKITRANVKGITHCKTYHKWKPQLYENRKSIYSGTFRTLEEASNNFIEHLEQKIQ